jgi:hypothetical protein
MTSGTTRLHHAGRGADEAALLLPIVTRQDNGPQIAALALVLVVYAGLMTLIYTLDRPFSGFLAVEPTAIESTAADFGADYEESYDEPPPCDEQGNAL